MQRIIWFLLWIGRTFLGWLSLMITSLLMMWFSEDGAKITPLLQMKEGWWVLISAIIALPFAHRTFVLLASFFRFIWNAPHPDVQQNL